MFYFFSFFPVIIFFEPFSRIKYLRVTQLLSSPFDFLCIMKKLSGKALLQLVSQSLSLCVKVMSNTDTIHVDQLLICPVENTGNTHTYT